MDPLSRARYQVGIALDHDRVAVLADADCFALAQAQQTVLGCVLRDAPWRATVVIVRLDDGTVLDRLRTSIRRDA